MKKLFTIILFVIINSNNFSQQITIDEDYSDWENISPIFTDDSGDGNGIDFGTLKISSDNSYIYFYLEVGSEISFQSDNYIELCLDTDNNINTGKAIRGIGAEVVYQIGARKGNYYSSVTKSISHIDIGLISSPTVTSDRFEFVLDRKAIIDGNSVFPQSSMKIVIQDNSTNGDFIPNVSGGLSVKLEDRNFTSKDFLITKKFDVDFRVMSYNVERDNLFDPSKRVYFDRLIKAVNPDIIGFEEIYDHSSQDASNIVAQLFPNETWYHHKANNDIIYVGKYKVLNSYPLDGNTAFLLDLTNSKQMLFIVAHPPCCSNDYNRQNEIDHFMSFVRDAKDGSGNLMLPKDSPIIIVGDMNLVGLSQQQTTLITGDIVNTNSYGQKFNPDWDGTDFADVKPINPNKPTTFTWYGEYSSYSPGRLDYIVYSSSVIETTNSFSLFTDAIPIDTLNFHSLQPGDDTNAADHIPLVSDFKFRTGTDISSEKDNMVRGFTLSQNYPNPFNPSTTFKYSIPAIGTVKFELYNSLGEKVKNLFSKTLEQGIYTYNFDGSKLSAGIYFITLSFNENVLSRKIVLMK